MRERIDEKAARTPVRRRWVGVVALVLVASQRLAWAQAAPPTDGKVTQASEHFARGVKLYQEDDFRAALIEFSRAYELAPNWAVLYNVGQAHYSLRDYAAALRTLEKYVREGGEQIAPDRRTQVEREIGELRGRVAHVTVVSNVDGVDVALDDAPFGRASASESMLVGAGRHKLSASRAGFAPVLRVVDIAGGDTLTIRLDLVPETMPSPAAEHEQPSYAGAIISGLVGVAGVAVGTTFGVLTLNGKSTLDGECSGAKVCPSKAQSDIDAYTRNGTISGIGFGVGALGLVLGGYLFFHERGKEAPQTRARIVPWVGPGGGGLSGTF
jgi:hypothetical protein